MASLRSKIRDGRYTVGMEEGERDYTKEMQENLMRRANSNRRDLLSTDTILVNAQGVADSLVESEGDRSGQFNSIPCPKPPFRTMWLEARLRVDQFNNRQPVGALVERTDDGPKIETILGRIADQLMAARIKDAHPASLIIASIWGEGDGMALFLFHILWWLDQAGAFLGGCYFPHMEKSDVELAWLLHSFARMNCHNVKLVPMKSGAPKIKPSKTQRPFSYWHEIVVTSLPELRREQKSQLAPDGEKREIRFHKVRGHYADYRNGKGLFGKLKILVYIEEHTAGVAELGTVMSSYTVK